MCIWGPNGTIKLSDSIDATGFISNPLGRMWAPNLCKAHGGFRGREEKRSTSWWRKSGGVGAAIMKVPLTGPPGQDESLGVCVG